MLVSRNGYNKSFVNADFYAANLNGINFNQANLQGANLNHATLNCADLRGACLRKSRALGTDFTGACLTGACLESWSIDSRTILENVDCQYVFLLAEPNQDGHRERRPHNPDKSFQPGDFEKYFKEILDTIQLLIPGGSTSEDFRAAFQKIMQTYGVTSDDILGWERKGEDVLLTVQPPPGTDKGKLEADFDQVIEARLEAARAAGLLEGERRRADSLEKTLLTLAARNTANIINQVGANPMTENRTVHITGDVTGSTLNLGEISGNVTNTITQLQQSTQPQAAELAELLKQLQSAIETEPNLPADDKAEALEQVGTLAKAGEQPQDGTLKKLSNTAIKILKGTIASLPDTAKLADAAAKLLPLISKVLGLG